LLSGTPATPRDNLSAQIFQIFLQTETTLDRRQMKEVGVALLSANPPSALIERLESFATALEQERAGILAKMRGRA
jgi:hypothetical protein